MTLKAIGSLSFRVLSTTSSGFITDVRYADSSESTSIAISKPLMMVTRKTKFCLVDESFYNEDSGDDWKVMSNLLLHW